MKLMQHIINRCIKIEKCIDKYIARIIDYIFDTESQF